MAQIVAAMATVHSPVLLTRPPNAPHAQLEADIVAMRALGALLDETKPDAIIFFGSDHVESFSLNAVPTFAIVDTDRARASFGGREYDLPIHVPLADALLDGLVAND